MGPIFKVQEIQEDSRSHLGTNRFSQKSRCGITTKRFVISQQSAFLIYFEAEPGIFKKVLVDETSLEIRNQYGLDK